LSESINARQGIKTLFFANPPLRACVLSESINARQGIKTH